jgi:tetratricopeptide (TPR) repeat protein
MLSHVLRKLSDPERLSGDWFARRLVSSLCLQSSSQLAALFAVLLHRLPARQRAIVGRYELNAETLPTLLKELAVSRRQFFRDRKRALEKLLTLLPQIDGDAGAQENAASRAEHVSVQLGSDRLSLERCAIVGLRNAGANDLAVARLERLLPTLNERDCLDVLLEIGEIAMEYGDKGAVQRIVDELTRNGLCSEKDEVANARLLSLKADLAERVDDRVALDARAVQHLRHAMQGEAGITTALTLLECLRLLGTDCQRTSLWERGRTVLRDASQIAKSYGLESLPAACAVRAELEYNDGLQFGKSGDALDALRRGLDEALLHGWFTVATEIAAMIIHLSVIRSRYTDAVAWYDWLSTNGSERLPEWQQHVMLSEGAHALTMTKQPGRAIAILNSSDNHRACYAATLKVRRSEALEALGDPRRAVREAMDALADSESARFLTGIARSKRVLASCYRALGQDSKARTHLADSIALCEAAETPYEQLRTMAIASVVLSDEKLRAEAIELARLLLEAGGSHRCIPPAFGNDLITDRAPPKRWPSERDLGLRRVVIGMMFMLALVFYRPFTGSNAVGNEPWQSLETIIGNPSRQSGLHQRIDVPVARNVAHGDAGGARADALGSPYRNRHVSVFGYRRQHAALGRAARRNAGGVAPS